MEYISRKSVNELMDYSSATPAVTIYAPMHVTASPPHISGNQLRFKNLFNEAISQLSSDEKSRQFAEELRRQHDKMHDDLELWKHQTKGLLLCARPGMVRMFHLPVDTEEYVAVDEVFHLAWAMGVVQHDQPYYVLSVAQHKPKLLRGNMYGLHPTGLKLPATIKEGLNIDEAYQKSENQGSASATGSFNGRGGARDPQEDDRQRFFRLIDSFVTEHIGDATPLILTGIEAETVEYRNISRYPNLIKPIIAGNQAETPLHKLFEKAYAIVQQEVIEPAHAAAVEEYQNIQGAAPDKASHDSKTIFAAAKQGRVDKLLVRMTRETSDTIRDRLQAVTRITFPEPEARKHLNELAATVWRMSGSVIGLSNRHMPGNATMVATLRY